MNRPAPRPPRRTLRRQARVLPPHLLHRQVLDELAQQVRAAVQQASRRRGEDVDLGVVLELAWLAFGVSPWCVADLRKAQIIGERDGPAAGAALRELLDAGGRWGRLRLSQVPGKATRDGCIWVLARA